MTILYRQHERYRIHALSKCGNKSGSLPPRNIHDEHAAILKAANHPDVMDKVKAAGGVYFDMGLEETQAWQKRIQTRWNNIVQETGIKLDK